MQGYQLAVSQTSGLQKYDRKIAERLAIATELALKETSCTVTRNDGTNACVFLCLKFIDRLMISSGSGNVLQDNIQWIATEVISNLPKILNDHRDKNLMYSVMSAYVIMRDSNLLENRFEFSEELPYQYTVFSSDGRRLLEHTMRRLEEEGNFLAIYTCEPYSLIIGSIDRQLFAADTHAIPLQCDGNLNGQIRVYDPSDKRSCHAVCCWLWRRLSESGVKSSQGQSFAVVTQVCSDVQASGEKEYYKTDEKVRQMLKQYPTKYTVT